VRALLAMAGVLVLAPDGGNAATFEVANCTFGNLVVDVHKIGAATPKHTIYLFSGQRNWAMCGDDSPDGCKLVIDFKQGTPGNGLITFERVSGGACIGPLVPQIFPIQMCQSC
jgi:hypothetical protein